MKIYNTNNLRKNLINKGISIDKEDIDLFNQSDYYQVINAHKMLFITDVEDIDKIVDNIDKGIEIERYKIAFEIKSFKDKSDLKNQIINFLSLKYGIKAFSLNDKINELKRIKYIHHIYDSKSNFNDFYRMYEFEHDFRILLLKYVLKIENGLKQTFIRTLNDFGNIKDSFLTDITNYNTSVENYSNSIRTLKDILSLYDSTKSKAISRKVEQNITIPYWILINEMTFGNVLQCIKNLKSKYSNKIYENLIIKFTMITNNTFSNLNFKDTLVFKIILDYIGKFRNMLAHNQPIFSYNIKDNSLFNFNDLSYFLPCVSDGELNNKKNNLGISNDKIAIKECQQEINTRMKIILRKFFNKDNFNKDKNRSNLNLSFMIYFIYKINKVLDNECYLKIEILNLFYNYNILIANDKNNSNNLARKYLKHFDFDKEYTKYTGISFKFLNEL